MLSLRNPMSIDVLARQVTNNISLLKSESGISNQ